MLILQPNCWSFTSAEPRIMIQTEQCEGRNVRQRTQTRKQEVVSPSAWGLGILGALMLLFSKYLRESRAGQEGFGRWLPAPPHNSGPRLSFPGRATGKQRDKINPARTHGCKINSEQVVKTCCRFICLVFPEEQMWS